MRYIDENPMAFAEWVLKNYPEIIEEYEGGEA